MQQKYGITLVINITPVNTDEAPSLDLKWPTVTVEGEFQSLARRVLEDVYHEVGEALDHIKKSFKPGGE
jgi:hypothetical protein